MGKPYGPALLMPRLRRVRFLESLPSRQQLCLGYAEKRFIRAPSTHSTASGL
nr:MAG TPA: hypothetical protein [Caudoviricetes sp.]